MLNGLYNAEKMHQKWGDNFSKVCPILVYSGLCRGLHLQNQLDRFGYSSFAS